ncbi:MAG: hypothetical protein AABX31_01695 [Nanoarchaeota archaeon]
MELAFKELLLLSTFTHLPKNSEAVIRFEKSYLFRNRFPFLGESGSDQDSSGLVYAVSKALSLSIGFSDGGSAAFIESGKGIETISCEFLEALKPREYFQQKLLETVPRLSCYTLDCFFTTLDWVKVDYAGMEKLQMAVLESFQNYSRIAALGIEDDYIDHTKIPAVSRKASKNSDIFNFAGKPYVVV